jgi:hypothetical protein
MGEARATQEPSQNETQSQASVAHACNPRYSGGRDQEDHPFTKKKKKKKKKNPKKGLVEGLEM